MDEVTDVDFFIKQFQQKAEENEKPKPKPALTFQAAAGDLAKKKEKLSPLPNHGKRTTPSIDRMLESVAVPESGSSPVLYDEAVFEDVLDDTNKSPLNDTLKYTQMFEKYSKGADGTHTSQGSSSKHNKSKKSKNSSPVTSTFGKVPVPMPKLSPLKVIPAPPTTQQLQQIQQAYNEDDYHEDEEEEEWNEDDWKEWGDWQEEEWEDHTLEGVIPTPHENDNTRDESKEWRDDMNNEWGDYMGEWNENDYIGNWNEEEWCEDGQQEYDTSGFPVPASKATSYPETKSKSPGSCPIDTSFPPLPPPSGMNDFVLPWEMPKDDDGSPPSKRARIDDSGIHDPDFQTEDEEDPWEFSDDTIIPEPILPPSSPKGERKELEEYDNPWRVTFEHPSHRLALIREFAHLVPQGDRFRRMPIEENVTDEQEESEEAEEGKDEKPEVSAPSNKKEEIITDNDTTITIKRPIPEEGLIVEQCAFPGCEKEWGFQDLSEVGDKAYNSYIEHYILTHLVRNKEEKEFIIAENGSCRRIPWVYARCDMCYGMHQGLFEWNINYHFRYLCAQCHVLFQEDEDL